jgi:ADP-ribose pyrophosphatase YjhB (NUDIX family)/RimJ/RimL family protein N-acetyltransferase
MLKYYQNWRKFMTHKGTITLKTERLILREVDESSMGEVGELKCSIEQRQFTNSPLWALLQTGFGDRKFYRTTYAICLSDKVIGMLTIERYPDSCRLADMLIDIFEQRKGYALQAVKLALELIYAENQYKLVDVHIALENTASKGLALKAEFTDKGVKNVGYAEMAVLEYTFAENYFSPMPALRENWGQGVGGVVIHNGKVLLARRIGGKSDGKLIIPGGYVNYGETPQDALKREILEETGVTIEPRDIVGIRFNMHDWYVMFRADYISGEAYAADSENSEVLWVDVAEIANIEITGITRLAIERAISGVPAFQRSADYDAVGSGNPPFSLYL